MQAIGFLRSVASAGADGDVRKIGAVAYRQRIIIYL